MDATRILVVILEREKKNLRENRKLKKTERKNQKKTNHKSLL